MSEKLDLDALDEIDSMPAGETPRVHACITAVMKQFPGYSASAQARYYEEVHQHLAPLARDLERELSAAQARIRELESASQPGGGEAIREALATYETIRDAVGGCSDGGCIVKRPIGMHTNGGCKCHKYTVKAARMMWAGQQLANALRADPSAWNGGAEYK